MFMRSVLLSLAAAFFTFAAHADDVKVGAIVVSNAWAPASAGTNGAAYATIKNDGPIADKLIGAATEADAMAHLHTTTEENGVTKMRAADAVDIPAHGTATLAPGGVHIMLMALAKPLKEGDKLDLALTFKNAGTVKVVAVVGKVGAAGIDHGAMDHMKMGMPKSDSGR